MNETRDDVWDPKSGGWWTYTHHLILASLALPEEVLSAFCCTCGKSFDNPTMDYAFKCEYCGGKIIGALTRRRLLDETD